MRAINSKITLTLISCFFLLLTLCFAPTFSAYLMGVNTWVSPVHSNIFFSIPNIYFYITAILALTSISIIALAYMKKGIYRYIAMYLMIVLVSFLCALIVSDLVFNFIQKAYSVTLNPFYALLAWFNLPAHSQSIYIVCLTLCIIATALLLFFLNQSGYTELGDARLATPVDAYRAGLLLHSGIMVGKHWGQALRVGGFEHVLGFAPTGSGKTSAIAIPNLLTWHGSCIANDLKLTLWETTKAYREEKLNQKCFLFSPTDTTKKTHRYNPLSAIRTDSCYLVADCQRLSHLLVPHQHKESPMWGQLARQLLVALLIYIKVTDGCKATLSQLNAILKQKNLVAWLKITNDEDGLPEAFYKNSQTFLSQPEKTQGSTLATLNAQFELYGDPNIAYATSACDFDIHALRKEKITIYIGIPANDLTRLAPLITIFWEQVIYAMLSHIPKKNEPVPLLCLMDEFGALSRMDVLRNALKLLREYRVRCVLLIQQLAQLKEHYTQDEAQTFLSITTKVAFKPDSLEDAEYLSKLLGNKTLKVKSGSNSAHESGGSSTKSYNYQAVPLMRADKLMRIRKNQALIIKSGHMPILAKQYRWYKEAQRYLLAPNYFISTLKKWLKTFKKIIAGYRDSHQF
ncbi:MAG: hypothetical protein CMF49_07955 [Legionellales bacterium]|nr:hypothetical protein [Legionellales bacterium]